MKEITRQKRPVVYIASPYTKGDVAVNVRDSFFVADKLWEEGFLPLPPLFSHFWHFLSPKDYNVWMEMDFEHILNCDFLLRLPGESIGADLEVDFAKNNHIPVFFTLEALLKYCTWR